MKVALPIVLGQLAQMSFNVVDTVMAGHLGAKALAAVSVGMNLFNPLFIFAIGVFLALNPIVAHLNGRGEQDGIGEHLTQGLWLSLFLALPSFFLLRHTEPLILLLGIEASVVPTTLGFLQALSWGVFPLFAVLALRFFNEGLFNTRPMMVLNLAAIPLYILFNDTLMHGKFGFPAYGAIGIGYATASVWTLQALALFAYTARTHRYAALRLFHRFTWPRRDELMEILKMGVPIAVSLGMEALLFIAVGLLIGRLDVTTIAGHQIALNIASVAFMVPLGVSMAITARVGYYAGQGAIAQVRRAGFIGIALAGAFMLVTISLLLMLPETITGFYTNDQGVQQVALQLLFLAAIFQLSDGLQVSGQGALRGLKDTQVPMLTNALAYWGIGFPISYWLGTVQGRGAVGFWIGLVAGLTAAALFHNGRFWWLSRRWRPEPATERVTD